ASCGLLAARTPMKSKKLNKTSARDNVKNGPSIVLLPGILCHPQQCDVLFERPFDQRLLLGRQLPIALFHCFGQPWKLQVRVRVASRIKQMLEPRPPRNPARVEPI